MLFQEDQEIEEDAFDTLWPMEDDHGHGHGNDTNMSNLRQAFECIGEKFFYAYYGSETVPPCDEKVVWLVLRSPLPIRSENLMKICDRINDGEPNNRPIQDREAEVHVVSDAHCGKYISWKRYEHEMREHYEEELKEKYEQMHHD